METIRRVKINKLNINHDEIYPNKLSTQNNADIKIESQNSEQTDKELSALIYADGTALIYEGDTPIGWTTIETLDLDTKKWVNDGIR